MDLFSNLQMGFSIALSPEILMYCFIGVTLGTVVGILPGIGALAAIAMLLPMTYFLSPAAAIIMLAGLYYGANYGSSTSAILLNIPGAPSSAITCLDGYPMARQGRAGVALIMTTLASFAGSSMSILLVMAFAPPLAQFAINFGSPEYFSVMLLGLLASSSLSQGSFFKGMVMVFAGLLLGMVGLDVNSGVARYTYGSLNLQAGISIVAIAMGIFGLAEVLANIGMRGGNRISMKDLGWRTYIPTRKDLKQSFFPIMRGTAVGAWFGLLPGTGSAIASFISYAVEKRVSKTPERFGKGAIEGITAPEAANNSASQAAFIPTLTLGIPGDVVMALMLGALMIHGISVGPRTIIEHADLFWALVASFWIGNFMLLVLNAPLIFIWVRLIAIPYQVLYPIILALVCVGVYSVNFNTFDIYVVIVAGIIGYVLRVLGFPAAPMLLGFILGPMVEENFRRSLMLSRGSFDIFVTRPVSASLLAAGLLFIIIVAWAAMRERQKLQDKKPD
ncbi:MAG: tripartite tricarboxylate transporter permease [Salinarimonadaceae bacterium]|nr:MAG: tripartite tricarboxylate transporter permease [Salinarimonadaceae bacterium]